MRFLQVRLLCRDPGFVTASAANADKAGVDPFIDQLKALCAVYPTRAKWAFVPTHAIGRTHGDRLVLEGTDWANLRFVTPLDIALRMGAPFLVERAWKQSRVQLRLRVIFEC